MSQNLPPRLRPVDLARAHGLSTQAVRNYEEQGVLPQAERSPSGYRMYTPAHRLALNAFLALIPGCGHARAGSILRAVHRGDLDGAFALLGQAHEELAEDRATFRRVRAALEDLHDPDDADTPPLFVGDVARRLGVVPATLRAWERAGIVAPPRDRATGYRCYGPGDVRDARMAEQLRRGGYGLARIAELTAQVRAAGGVEPLRGTLDGWSAALTRRGRALVAGAAALDAFLSTLGESADVGPAIP
ncbi:MerR family transcriptional regulator [Tsukamurella pulmonis]|uniref:DNA-binding transcriptional regulator, MerR family n=1 Tax=Tsukamurella pulmonis TaxID=47312 RepID=A0A1H1D021_9ACTN|nr:MerR family DNA-binding transcriptional regulator [Tsukamurella pulmonis]KXO89682.1 MerR family transcriptional regulator [Tsukamurella pulmonis]SDQ69629.1 DNA-binding transcriptional regulator, MerR family [Tsukamurella pulmonis]SUP22745.1 zinc-responsive transcriptional regulator [Tsukamurella pulmonis]